jgi:hypothetical protein
MLQIRFPSRCSGLCVLRASDFCSFRPTQGGPARVCGLADQAETAVFRGLVLDVFGGSSTTQMAREIPPLAGHFHRKLFVGDDAARPAFRAPLVALEARQVEHLGLLALRILDADELGAVLEPSQTVGVDPESNRFRADLGCHPSLVGERLLDPFFSEEAPQNRGSNRAAPAGFVSIAIVYAESGSRHLAAAIFRQGSTATVCGCGRT